MEQLSWPIAIVYIGLIIGLFGTFWKAIDLLKPPLTNKDIARIANEVLEQLRKET